MIKTTELIFRCPDIQNQADATSIHEVLTSSPGIGDVEVDYHTKRVRVVTANQDGGEDVRKRLSKAGFPAVDEADVDYLSESA